MFPFHPSHDDLGFEIPTTSQRGQIQDDLVTDYHLLEPNLISFSVGSNDREVSKRRDLELCEKRQKERSSHGCTSKKVMHREVERKRRQEMSHLYASLRSHLPHHLFKGKHSVCDQIQEATSHIKTMEKNIEELKGHRNKLKSLSSSSGGKEESSNGRNDVTINIVSDGMEILISHSIERSGDFELSRLLAELQRSELDVIHIVSSKINERFVHKIQVKCLGMEKHGALVLQERLSKAIQ
ncbi:transcription factor bHLH36-like [Salvia divinorum]|uniref:Transcription factor bHLH36-like n=1 Tax=Salvia divinorum TaxID=28513 RepID=A0ABD1HF15_SALDI